jgi:hypothetical protein
MLTELFVHRPCTLLDRLGEINCIGVLASETGMQPGVAICRNCEWAIC